MTMTTAVANLRPPRPEEQPLSSHPGLHDGGDQYGSNSHHSHHRNNRSHHNRSDGSYSNSQTQNDNSGLAVSQLESSGNPHNRGFVTRSSSMASASDNTYNSSSHATATTLLESAGGGGAPPSSAPSLLLAPQPPRMAFVTSTTSSSGNGGAITGNSRLPLQQQQQPQLQPLLPPLSTASASSINNKDGGSSNDHKDVWIEERRRRLDAVGGSSSATGDAGYTIHHYIRGRLLGKGGFAKVYLCTAVDTGKHYAVKVVPKANLVKARARQKLQAEIKIHRTLKHPHVCEFKHFFEDKENCYILLELCHNQSLNELLKRRKRLTEPEAAYYMTHLLDAVQYLHDKNVIHRDLKLGNLFLDKQLHIKVGDLGLATRVDDRDEKRKTICGTPNYIAPEIIQNDKAKRGHSFEVDVWSMGVILYTVLVGKPPYEAKNVKATYQRILKNEYSFPPHCHVSSMARDLVARMLQSEPSDRPSLQEIAAHPFLAFKCVPEGLPPSVLHFAPQWTYTSDRQVILAVDDNGTTAPPSFSSSHQGNSSGSSGSNSSALPRKLGLPRPTGSAPRQPFGYRDVNSAHRGQTSVAEGSIKAPPPTSSSSSSAATTTKPAVIDMERVVRNALVLSGVATTSTPSTSSVASSSKAAPPPTSSSVSTKPRGIGALAALAASGKSVYSCGFKIFDEAASPSAESPSANSKPPPTSHSSRSLSSSASEESSLIRRAKALTLSSGKDVRRDVAATPTSTTSRSSSNSQRHHHHQAAFASFASSTTSSQPAAVDGEILQGMVRRLDAVLEVTASRRGAYRLQLPRSVPATHGPTKWVCRYVDYTTKYGLGFLLNDGSSGVYFNDSTKAVLERDGEVFQYVERKKVDGDSPTSSAAMTTETFTLSSHPESLNKKVTLLKHFRNYLLEQHKDSPDALKSPRSDGLVASSQPGSSPTSNQNLVYVKKWVRTKHSILFRLSDQTVQVVFFDQSELLLTPDDRYLTYVDKTRKRMTFPFTDELVGSSSELETRLKYAKEMLGNLSAASRPR